MKLAIALTLILAASCLGKPLKSSSTAAQQCGVPAVKPDTSGNIVGGEDAVPYSWPWQVGLFTQYYPGSAKSYLFCSGTLISNQWVMTAGHCFATESGTPITDPTGYSVKLGVFNQNDDTEPEEVILNITEIHVNPKYKVHLLVPSYDITLLKLVKAVDLDEDVSPICLPTAQDQPLPTAGTGVYITGWGTTSEGGEESTDLEQATVPLVDSTACLQDYPKRFDNETMFCAGLPQGGVDTCQGDSGGPVAYQDPATGVWTQLGITSWGAGCAEAGHYGVYSKVSAYIDFIHQYVPDV